MSAEIWLNPPQIPSFSNLHPVTAKDIVNLTNWKNAFFHHPAPYLTDKGFPNPACLGNGASSKDTHVREGRSVSGDSRHLVRHNHTTSGTYVIGESDACMGENNTNTFCNGPLKPNTVYVWVCTHTLTLTLTSTTQLFISPKNIECTVYGL